MRSTSVFALVDCNNFFASCERVFNPALVNKPIVVLSSNDGCVIARSNEAKTLGIPMGAPLFKYQALMTQHHVQVFSSNFALYRSFSKRVMACLKIFSPDCEEYSVDEAFLRLDLLANKDYITLAKTIREQVLQWTGIPVSIGIAPTKTLAKVANRYAKKQTTTGIFQLTEANRDTLLSNMPLEDIWGISWRLGEKLRKIGIKSALDLKSSNPQFMKKKFGVVLERMVWELQGVSCLGLLEKAEPKQSIQSSRSFGKTLTECADIAEALAHYTVLACQKLRSQNSLASGITVFLHTSPFNPTKPYYSNHTTIHFETPLNDTGILITFAKQALKTIFKSGYDYVKTGIILLDLVDGKYHQMSLFDTPSHPKRRQLYKALDAINLVLGNNTLFHAAEGIEQSWKTKHHKRSPRYTTCWNELAIVY